MSWEHDYLDLCANVIATGYRSDSRAGATRSLPGCMLKIPLDEGFPLLTTRKMYPAGVFGELAGFVRGATDLATYEKFGCNYWKENAAEWAPNKGLPQSEWQIGRVYGAQWTSWTQCNGSQSSLNQLRAVIGTLKTDPFSRRHVVTAWNPDELADGVLPPCHIMFQFYVRDGGLHCCVYMRSVDLCIGLPSDIALYAMLTNLVAKDVGLSPKSLTFFLADTHVYEGHVEQFAEQNARHVSQSPSLGFLCETNTLTFDPSTVALIGYTPCAPIKYPFNK